MPVAEPLEEPVTDEVSWTHECNLHRDSCQPCSMSFFQLLDALASDHARSEDEINWLKAECDRLRPREPKPRFASAPPTPFPNRLGSSLMPTKEMGLECDSRQYPPPPSRRFGGMRQRTRSPWTTPSEMVREPDPGGRPSPRAAMTPRTGAKFGRSVRYIPSLGQDEKRETPRHFLGKSHTPPSMLGCCDDKADGKVSNGSPAGTVSSEDCQYSPKAKQKQRSDTNSNFSATSSMKEFTSSGTTPRKSSRARKSEKKRVTEPTLTCGSEGDASRSNDDFDLARQLVLAGESPRLTVLPTEMLLNEPEWPQTTSTLDRIRFCISRDGAYSLLRWPGFDGFIGCIIVFDGMLLGIEAENNLNPFVKDRTWLVACDWMFKSIFLAELCLRFYAFRIKTALMNSWIRFDTFLVVCAGVDVLASSVLSGDGSQEMLDSMLVLRLFRLARLVRAARLMVQFRTLWLLISGLRASFQTVMWTWVLLLLISYTFAVLGMEVIPPRDLSRDTLFNQVASDKFGGLLRAMLTLLQVLTLDSIAAIYRPLIREGDMGPFVIVYFVLFILFVSMALMNLVTAVMVEGSMQQAQEDRQAMRALEEKRKKALIPKLREMFEALDEDNSGEVSLDEIEAAPKQLQDELKTITKVDDLTEVFYLLDDDDSGSVMIEEFLEGILKASTGDVMQKLQMARLVKQISKMQAHITATGGMQEPKDHWGAHKDVESDESKASGRIP
eukprot:TRINITY_DN18436_c0_g1_i2.p1 TRINITY_DN18436_c0_g1~~TRINITY_DN18436_c0_g1_i2.p1  ORF type:complete len:725 (+),score=112.63 TRINITY_DN18436_c0_g1_i2:70-2244(+)